MTQRTLIVGCGVIGNAIGVKLYQQNHQVYGIRRQKSLLAHCINPLSIDLNLTRSQWQQSLPEVDNILISLTPNSRTPEGYTQCYLTNVQKIVKHYHSSSIKYTFLSSTAVYGENQGTVTTSSPRKPNQWNGKILAQAEQFLLDHTDVCIINSAGIYGMMRWWLFDVISGKNTTSLNWRKISNRIHQEDLINFIARSIGMQKAKKSKRYILCDDHSCRYDEIINWLETQAFPVDNAIKQSIRQLHQQKLSTLGKHCQNNVRELPGFTLTYPTFKEGLIEQLTFWKGWQKLSSFQQNVLHEVTQIPWGKTKSYRQLGDSLNSRAYQAIGQVLKKNPCAPWIPCHRVIASDGTIGGYMGAIQGEAINKKRQLLAAENIII